MSEVEVVVGQEPPQPKAGPSFPESPLKTRMVQLVREGFRARGEWVSIPLPDEYNRNSINGTISTAVAKQVGVEVHQRGEVVYLRVPQE
jgi:hypothetical protein